MIVSKENKYIICRFDDGRTVKYDLESTKTYGLSGNQVKSLKAQLRGYTISEFIDSCEDDNYRRFLKYTYKYAIYKCHRISNAGSLLDSIKNCAKMEQIFSSGIKQASIEDFNYNINEIPNGLIRICKQYDCVLSNRLVESYKANPNEFQYAFGCLDKYISLDANKLCRIFTYDILVYRCGKRYIINYLSENYGYQIKPLMQYIDDSITFEAIEDIDFLLRELLDYARMMNEIGQRFDRYPRHFLTTHRIAARNYTRLKKTFDEKAFSERYNSEMECEIGDYVFIYPKSTQDIKDEAVSMNNCVASYISKVIDGECDILFMRKKAFKEDSLVTIEVKNNKIVQSRRKYNYPITDHEQQIVDMWNKRYEKIMKNKEKENAA